MDGRPIGMFDSGFGGLTVARALIDLAPHEEFVYVGDTGRYPYGPRNLDEVRSFAVQIGRRMNQSASRLRLELLELFDSLTPHSIQQRHGRENGSVDFSGQMSEFIRRVAESAKLFF